MNMRSLLLLSLVWLAFIAPVRADNPGVAVVPDPSIYTRVFAISDVHGEYAHLRTLLRAAHVLDGGDRWNAGKSLMVVVGDSIDKGPQSIEVLQLWLRLQTEAAAKGGRLIVLLGNHEAEFLANPDNHKTAETHKDADVLHIPLSELADPKHPLGAFLRSLPVAARVGDWVFCHAGWIPDEPWPQFVAQARTVLNAGNYGDPFLAAPDSILEKKTGANGKKWWHSEKEVRELERRLDADGLAGVVLGHQPKALGLADNVGETPDGRIVKIDSGMAPLTADDGAAGGADDQPGQPYAGHLLLIPNPTDLIGRSHPLRIVSVAADGKQGAAPIEEP